MACRTHVVPLLLVLLPFVLAVAADVAPGPTPADLNLTSILENGGQFTTMLRLLHATRMSDQLTSQLKNSYDGMTLFAPNDNAFAKLKTGTLNGLTDQQQIQLLLYHVLPRYYSLTTFQTASNPLHTEASGPGGMYSVNVTTSPTSHLVNVSTGIVNVPISSTLRSDFPLAVYSVDDVLLPEQMFGSVHKASAPAPGQATEAAGKKAVPKSDVASEPSPAGEEAEDSANQAAAGAGGSAGWNTVVACSLLAVANLVGA